MAYKVTISDGTILEKSIDSVTFNADTPSDNFYEMRTYTINSMTITGRIGAGEKTISLYEWALLPANNPKCYKEIEVEQTHAGELIRKVKFSMAFVVDYSESFAKQEGVGYFSILVRQLSEIDIDVTSQSPQGAVIDSKSEAIIEKEIVPIVAPIITTKKPESRMDISSLDTEELKKMFAKEIEQSKEAYARAVKVKQKTKKKGCIASNGSVTLSGYGEKTKASKEFTNVPLETMFDYCKKIGHELPAKIPSCFDNGLEGSYYACHAEKQLSLLTDKPIGITKDMCQNCIEYFSKHAKYTGKVKITSDPLKTRIFFPNGVIREL